MGFYVEYGDIFNRYTEAIVNPVNCVGIMGAGLAKEFKKRYPEMFYAYRSQCRKRQVQLGKVWYWIDSDPSIICFPTKNHWRDQSSLKDIKDGLKNLKHNPHNFNSISLPALGCGLGGLKLLEVKKIMEYIFGDVDYRVELVIRE